jgi:20S proteasome subunit beta 6
VGDGLEMFIVFAKGTSVDGLQGLRNVEEIPGPDGGERLFVTRRDLKKD